MKNLLILLVLVLLTAACQSENASEPGASAGHADNKAITSKNSVALTMEGKTHKLNNIDWTKSEATVNAGKALFQLEQNGSPIQLKFNVTDAALLEKGSATYVVPVAKSSGVTVGLNFLDSSRRGIAMNQRILFSAGTVEVQMLNDHNLKMTFKGDGHPMTDSKTFPIEGSVDIAF
jgi:hypothetical protein